MTVLYLDCGMGAAGDMLTAALLELFEDREAVCNELNALGIPNVRFVMEQSSKCGIVGTRMRVFVEDAEEDEHMHHGHHHSHLSDIAEIFASLKISESVRENALAVYRRIAEGESQAHGVAVEQVHFHEVGSMDAIADVTAVCYLMEKLQVEKVYASAVHVGCGTVRCAHGVLPVPAPATVAILQGVPIYGGEITGELCTPTGAALLKHFVAEFGAMPQIRAKRIGYGMGKKDFPVANCVRAILGAAEDTGDTAQELCCNLDDMTGEAIAFAMQKLLDSGALDVFTTAVGMKKNRPGVLLTVLCKPEDKDDMVRLIFRHTTTLGIRQKTCCRYTLRRAEETVDTPYGAVRRKLAEGYGVCRGKYEYEDVARIAREQNLPLTWTEMIEK